MSTSSYQQWQQANRRYLMAAIAVVRRYLEQKLAHMSGKAWDEAIMQQALQDLEAAAKALPARSALDRLCSLFDLSPFERSLLLLCAGIELDESIAELCAALHGDDEMGYPTMRLSAVLPDADWGALSLAAPLRHWQLLEVSKGATLTTSRLKIDESILFFLTGVPYLDRRLAGIVESLAAADGLVPHQQQLAEQIAQTWAETAGSADEPVVQLCGQARSSKRAVAFATCDLMDLQLSVMSAHQLPTNAEALYQLRQLWDREAYLHEKVLLLECDGLTDEDQDQLRAVDDWMEHCKSFLLVSTQERRAFSQRSLLTLEVNKPTLTEQRQIWLDLLGIDRSLQDEMTRLVYQFDLDYPAIRAVCASVRGQLAKNGPAEEPANPQIQALWDTCRMQARPKLDNLVQRIESIASWEDLILPAPQMQMLQEIAGQVRHRAIVYDVWGFGSKGARGLGISALFAGASGTGKTMAAEVLAKELGLDLYRIDLSMVMNKYIGETEKNLRRVFDAAEAGGAILLFDEADALFGKRSEVKDSHDRYANVGISYLLQRMEEYRGLAILTTNMKDALDNAFLRRLRFIIEFPFPEEAQRYLIWQSVFPKQLVTEDLEFQKLARLSVAGGIIRNIAMRGAFQAAMKDARKISMADLMQATQLELEKMKKPLSVEEVKGWV